MKAAHSRMSCQLVCDGDTRKGSCSPFCGHRELEEEIGYKLEELELLTSIFTAPGFTDEVIHIYKGTGLVKGGQHLDTDEVLETLE